MKLFYQSAVYQSWQPSAPNENPVSALVVARIPNAYLAGKQRPSLDLFASGEMSDHLSLSSLAKKLGSRRQLCSDDNNKAKTPTCHISQSAEPLTPLYCQPRIDNKKDHSLSSVPLLSLTSFQVDKKLSTHHASLSSFSSSSNFAADRRRDCSTPIRATGPYLQTVAKKCEDPWRHPIEFLSKYEVKDSFIASGSTSYVMEVIRRRGSEPRVSTQGGKASEDTCLNFASSSDTRQACKVIKVRNSTTSSEAVSTGESFCCKSADLADVANELQVLRKLGSHPSILDLHDVFWSESGDTCYMITDLARGAP